MAIPNWLSGSNQNDLLGLLRYQLAGQSNMVKIYRVEGTDTPQKIISVYRNQQKICYTEEQSVEWLRTLANDLIKNEATLITMQNLTNITGSPHWVPLALSVDKHSLFFGDSLGNEIPKELRMAYTWWMAQHDASRNFESDTLMAVSSMSIGQQIDGHACGILAINALRHLIEPNHTLLNSGSCHVSCRETSGNGDWTLASTYVLRLRRATRIVQNLQKGVRPQLSEADERS